MKLAEIAQKLGCRLDGDPNAEIHGCLRHRTRRRPAKSPSSPTAATSLSSKPPKPPPSSSTKRLASTTAPTRHPPLAALRTSNPYLAFAHAIELFYHAPRYDPGFHPTALIARSAQIPEGAHIGPYCFVEKNVHIGHNAVLHSLVTIYQGARIGDDFFAHSHTVVRENCQIGNRVILQNGAIIGTDGLGFAKQSDGSWYKMQQSGPAVLEDDVEIQANACVDRATVGETRIGRGAKIDDLVIVGHASRVGVNTMLCGQVGLAGSTKVGDDCIFAGQVGTAGHLSIGDGSVITAKSGIPSDVPPHSMYSGYPAVDNRQWLKTVAALNRLPELQKRVRELEAELERLGGRPRTSIYR